MYQIQISIRSKSKEQREQILMSTEKNKGARRSLASSQNTPAL